MTQPADRADSPVVVIGFDAMDIGVARELMSAGRMPNLAAFLESAAWAPTQNPPGLLVGGLWPTVSTGCWPDKHGFYARHQLEPGTYEARRHQPSDISTPRVWDVLAAAGRRCAVLDVPITSPSKRTDVVHLVEWGSHDRLHPLSSVPASLVDDVVREFGEYPVPEICDRHRRRGELANLFDALREAVGAKERLATAFLQRGPWDLLWFVFSESHCAGHQFWTLHDAKDPSHDPATRAAMGDPMVVVYETIDGALGRLLARIGDSPTVVVLLSHGMGRHDDGEHLLDEILRRLDVAEKGPRRFVTLREHLYRRIQRPAREARDARTVYSERRFFKIPNNELYGAIRINVKGREPRGLVAPGAELEAVTARLQDDLREIENPDTGAPLIRDVWRADDFYQGPARPSLPDLFVVWNRGAPINGARSPKIGTIRKAPFITRAGDHRPTGLVAIRGAHVKRGQLPCSVRAIDIAPTIAGFLGVTLPDVDGEAVQVH